MRKRLKRKRHSCKMCKPNKTGGSCRWAPRELAKLKDFEQEQRENTGPMRLLTPD